MEIPRERFDTSAVRLDRTDPYLRVQSVTLFVRDLDRSLDFYENCLGFHKLVDGREQRAGAWVVVAPPDGPSNIVLTQPEPKSEHYKLIGRSSLVTLVTEDVMGKFREWNRRGVQFQKNPRLRRLQPGAPMQIGDLSESSAVKTGPIWGSVFARFRDIDGNSFMLLSFDEWTQAIEAQRRSIAEKLEAERRAAQELEIAKQVQSQLFPRSFPLLKSLEFAGVCHQARHVGGDYYDFLNLGQERLALVIGDISGKGIAAALLMANLQANLRSQCAIAVDPRRLLCSVNQLFCDNTADASFATLFFAEFDDTSRRLRYANCGHLPALLLRANNSVDRLSSTATIVGAFKDWDCALEECQLAPGDTLVLYTDGITESFNAEDEEFGEHRLIEVLRRSRHLDSESLLNAVVSEVRGFSPHEQRDDITLIIARCVA
jgi:serine phosphatase RsbU (regulator of sigma subunit)/catechol 2,3-dioxygenase-like lactoylglutathione lyase family enzyme